MTTVLLLGFRILLGLFLMAYCAYACLTVWAAHRWRKARQPLNPTWTPAVTLLKPVCGVDAEAYENFASFCRLDYPTDRLQILFGVLDSADPVIPLLQRLQTDFPHLDIALHCGNPGAVQGLNFKVCNLLMLLPFAKHEILVLCDSDMRVTPNYLRQVVAPFEDSRDLTQRRKDAKTKREANHEGHGEHRESPSSKVGSVGLVTCPYRGFRVQSFAAILESLGIGADFIPSALVSRATEGVGFAFGSTIALPRTVLEEIGGMEALLNELADDFRLGNGVKLAGYEVVLSDYVVEDVLGRERFGLMWKRRLRWARTVRACRPVGYAGSFVTYGTVWAWLFLGAMGFSRMGWTIAGSVLALRLITAFWVACCYTQDSNIPRYLPLLPLSDLFSFTLYVASYCGNGIVWRGERFRLLPGGKLARRETTS